MRSGTSSLVVSIAFFILFSVPAAVRGAGLFRDPRSLFQPADTVRVAVSVRQAAIDLGEDAASLLTVEARLRTGKRSIVELAAEFPAIRAGGSLAFGAGDCRVGALLRIFGDTLDASGVFVRAECRAPTGSPALAPFSYRSLDGSAGCELRGRVYLFDARAAALYTLAGERTSETSDFVHDNHASFAGAVAFNVARTAVASAVASWTRYENGATRNTLSLSLAFTLSESLAVGASAAAEGGERGAAAFDRLIGLTLTYRFPPPPASASPPATAP